MRFRVTLQRMWKHVIAEIRTIEVGIIALCTVCKIVHTIWAEFGSHFFNRDAEMEVATCQQARLWSFLLSLMMVGFSLLVSSQ